MTDPKEIYREQLAKEQQAWQRLSDNTHGGVADPELLAQWLAASRVSTAARDAAIDAMRGGNEDVQSMRRVALDALPASVQATVRRVLSGAERVDGADIGVCIWDPRAGIFTCLAAQTREQVNQLAADLIDTGFGLTNTLPRGCACDYIFDPIMSGATGSPRAPDSRPPRLG